MTAATMTEIKLLSTLGKKYGRSHRVQLDTHTPAEAVRWLLSQFPEARKYLSTAHEKGIQFAVFRGRGEHRENIGKNQLGEPAGDCITFAPIMQGAKNGGIFQVILGVALIALSFVPSLQVAAPYLLATGIGMAAGGMTQLLSPHPKLGKSSADSAGNQASYVFNGATNTTAQGNCVPVVYGRIRAGSAVISAGISAEEYVPASAGVGPGAVNGSDKKSPYEVPG